jgi:hypothetical protein
MNEGFNRGSWGWAPNGCHFNTKHGGIWFNDSSGDTGNRNYTSVCIAQVAEDAGCVGVTSAQNMTESCADELWAEAGCTTSHDHSAWRSWGKTNSLSLQSMKNDFAAWASLKSHGHVARCQSAIQTGPCTQVTSGADMTIECADHMWTGAGCTTTRSHAAWVQWGRNHNLSLVQMKNDFNAWATLTSENHVEGCASAFQMQSTPIVDSVALGAVFPTPANACVVYRTAPEGTENCQSLGGTLPAGAFVRDSDELYQCDEAVAPGTRTRITKIGSANDYVAHCVTSEHCIAWLNAPGTTACTGEGGQMPAGTYVRNANGLFACRDGAKDQWGHTVNWVKGHAQLEAQCLDLSGGFQTFDGVSVRYGANYGANAESNTTTTSASVAVSASAGAYFEATVSLAEGTSMTYSATAAAEASGAACAGADINTCVGAYAEGSASVSVSQNVEVTQDSAAGQFCAHTGGSASAGAEASGGAMVNKERAVAGATAGAGAKAEAEAGSCLVGQYGSIEGKAGVSIGPSVSIGAQMSFNFNGCTWSTSVQGDVHVLVGVGFEAGASVNFCAVGEKVAELATDLWYEHMGGEAVEEWTEGAAEDVADWTVGAANDMADWSTGAANDVASSMVSAADWTEGAAGDVASWTSGAANDVADWTTGAANDVADWTSGAAKSVASFFSGWW